MKYYILCILLLTSYTFADIADADKTLRKAIRISNFGDCQKAIQAGAQLNEIYEDEMLSGEFGLGTPLYFALCLQDTWTNGKIIELFLQHDAKAETRTDFVPEFPDDENEEDPETIT
jgi:hypothetical protein